MNPDPIVQITPAAAAQRGIAEGDWVSIETTAGSIKMRASLYEGMADNVVCAQYGWWFPEEDAPEYGWKKSSINLLFGHMAYDPETGSESCKSWLCEVRKLVL